MGNSQFTINKQNSIINQSTPQSSNQENNQVVETLNLSNINTSGGVNLSEINVNRSVTSYVSPQYINSLKASGLIDKDIQRLLNNEITLDDLKYEINNDSDPMRRKQLMKAAYSDSLLLTGDELNKLELKRNSLQVQIDNLSKQAQFTNDISKKAELQAQISKLNNEIAPYQAKLDRNRYLRQYIDNELNYYIDNVDLYTHKKDFTQNKTMSMDAINTFNKVIDGDKGISKEEKYSAILSAALNDRVDVLVDGNTLYIDGINHPVMGTDDHYRFFLECANRKLLTKEEVDVFNYIYNTEGSDAAYDYLEKNYYEYDNRWLAAKTQEDKEFAQEHEVIASTASVVLSPFEGMNGVVNSISSKVKGEKIARHDVYSRSDVYRSGVSEEIRESGHTKLAFVYDTGMSMADTGVLIATNVLSGGLTAAGQAVASATIMGSKAYTSTLNDALDRGLSDDKAILLASASGLTETAMESYSLGHLMNLEGKMGSKILEKGAIIEASKGKASAKLFYAMAGMVSQGIAEGEEEAATEIINYFSDQIITGDLSNYNQQINANLLAGDTLDVATKKANNDSVKQVGLAALGGFLSGIGFGGGKSISTNYNITRDMASGIMNEYDMYATNPNSVSSRLESRQIFEEIQQDNIKAEQQERIKGAIEKLKKPGTFKTWKENMTSILAMNTITTVSPVLTEKTEAKFNKVLEKSNSELSNGHKTSDTTELFKYANKNNQLAEFKEYIKKNDLKSQFVWDAITLNKDSKLGPTANQIATELMDEQVGKETADVIRSKTANPGNLNIFLSWMGTNPNTDQAVTAETVSKLLDMKNSDNIIAVHNMGYGSFVDGVEDSYFKDGLQLTGHSSSGGAENNNITNLNALFNRLDRNLRFVETDASIEYVSNLDNRLYDQQFIPSIATGGHYKNDASTGKSLIISIPKSALTGDVSQLVEEKNGILYLKPEYIAGCVETNNDYNSIERFIENQNSLDNIPPEKHISSLVTKINNAKRCNSCGGVYDANGKCKYCGEVNTSFKNWIQEINESLEQTPLTYENNIETIGALTKIKDVGIDKVNSVLEEVNYDSKLKNDLEKLDRMYERVINNEIRLTKKAYDTLFESLKNDSAMSETNSTMKTKATNMLVKAIIESNPNLTYNLDNYKLVYESLTNRISKDYYNSKRHINVDFVENGNMGECDGKHRPGLIQINKNLFETPVDTFKTLFHELTHEIQYITNTTNQEFSVNSIYQIMDEVNRHILNMNGDNDSYYYDNYNKDIILIRAELEAFHNEYDILIPYLNSIGVEVDNSIIEKNETYKNYANMYKDTAVRYYNGQLVNIIDLCGNLMKNHPEQISRFSQLGFFFKIDNGLVIKKDINDIETDYENYKNGSLKWNGDETEINYLYNSYISYLKENQYAYTPGQTVDEAVDKIAGKNNYSENTKEIIRKIYPQMVNEFGDDKLTFERFMNTPIYTAKNAQEYYSMRGKELTNKDLENAGGFTDVNANVSYDPTTNQFKLDSTDYSIVMFNLDYNNKEKVSELIHELGHAMKSEFKVNGDVLTLNSGLMEINFALTYEDGKVVQTQISEKGRGLEEALNTTLQEKITRDFYNDDTYSTVAYPTLKIIGQNLYKTLGENSSMILEAQITHDKTALMNALGEENYNALIANTDSMYKTYMNKYAMGIEEYTKTLNETTAEYITIRDRMDAKYETDTINKLISEYNEDNNINHIKNAIVKYSRLNGLEYDDASIRGPLTTIIKNLSQEELSDLKEAVIDRKNELTKENANIDNILETIERKEDILNYLNDDGLIDAKKLPLSANEETRIVQEKVINGEPLNIHERLYLRDAAVTEIDGVVLQPDHMYRAISTQDALVNYLNNNAISDNGQGKGYNSVNWYLGGTSTRYGKIVLETPANPNSFELAEDHGGFMSGNPYVRQAHSSNDAPVRFDELSRILFLDKTGKRVLYQIDTNSSYDINRDITIGNLLQEQDELMTTKNYYDSTIKDRAKLEKMSDEAKANLIEKSDQTNLKLEMINRKLYLSQATFDSEFTKIDVDTKSVGLKMGDAYAAGDDKETVKYFTEYDRLDNKRMIFRDNKKELAKLKEMVNAEGYNSLRDYGKLSYEEGLNLLDNKIQNATNNHDYTLAEKLMSKKEKYIKNFYVSPEEQLQANELANRLHETAKQIEPEVTQTIKELETPNAIIMDENHKLKKPNRIAAKILTSNKGKGKTILNPVIKDSLRYTYVIDKNNYVNEVNRIVDSLNEKGYNTYQLNNSWTSDGYKGINVTFMNENRNLFEVQFHTDESYIEKSSLTHEPYEIFRNSYLDDDIKRTARDIQNNFDRSVAIPPNVKTIKEINNTNMYDVRRETDAKQR